jgi:trigger factor
MIDKQIESYKANFGAYDQVDEIKGKDMTKGRLIELDENGNPATDGIDKEDAVMLPFYIKDEEEKAKFAEAKTGAIVVFNPFKAYEGHETEISSFLQIKKEEIANHTGDFSFEIKEITRYTEAEINTDLFDKVYEPGTVTSEEAFREKVKAEIATQLDPEGDYKFILDARKLLEDKAADLQFPDAFLKRWLLATGKEKSPEIVEEEYPRIIEDLKFHLIREKLIKENEIKVDAEDIKEYAKRATRAQFAQYGMSNVPDQLLENYSKEMLKKEETVRNLIDQATENKLIAVLKEQVTLEPKEVTAEEFQKLIEVH